MRAISIDALPASRRVPVAHEGGARPSPARLLARGLGRVLSRYWTVAAFVVAWQLWSWLTGYNQIVVPPPAMVFGDVVGNIGAYLPDLGWTLAMSAAGLVAGMALGTMIAVVVWSSRIVSGMMTPVALVMRSVPVVAMIPVLARVFGYSWFTVLVMTTVVSFFPAFVLVGSRLRAAPQATSDLMAVLGASRSTVLRLLLLPHAVPGLLVAFRLTAPTAVLAAMLAEYLMGGRGLGTLFAQSVSFHEVGRAWGAALVATVVSVACFVAARAVERRGTARFS
ncbi:ABC transporter permease subunit [Pseudonocardia sp.]|jgi:NitT/TauT family transport system permease protein|uniref:ABC transporter permease n=1 Tax=Pseudonocardia sp. TaxID=60912 RepID=UPI002D8E310A|nr:ABC transporter permease subunit [Pseudonocardia sp.]